MSLAMYAAPFNNDNNNVNEYPQQDTPINRKRTNNNKTQKRVSIQDYSSQKVNSVLQSLHDMTSNETNDLGDFNLIPPPSSAGVENTKMKEHFKVEESTPNKTTYGQINDSDDVDLQSLNNNFMNDKVVEKYYKNLIPTYNESKSKPNEQNKPYYALPNFQTNNFETDNYKVLTDKLNYMINLLEDQQDEKTNNVTEEVVLYSFLGIFIIFIVDSFARVGKYVR
jgi:hypothetical protein